jgi:hypothetical protein
MVLKLISIYNKNKYHKKYNRWSGCIKKDFHPVEIHNVGSLRIDYDIETNVSSYCESNSPSLITFSTFLRNSSHPSLSLLFLLTLCLRASTEKFFPKGLRK